MGQHSQNISQLFTQNRLHTKGTDLHIRRQSPIHSQLHSESVFLKIKMYWSLILLVASLGQSLAHSWSEQLMVITNGIFTGRNGYPRGYVSRSDSGFLNSMMVYLLPPPYPISNRTRIDDTDLLCAPTQRTRNQTANYLSLQASPGSCIAIKFLENRHVTLP